MTSNIHTFIFDDGKKRVNYTFEGNPTSVEFLDEVLQFMKACGYCFDMSDYLCITNDFDNRLDNTYQKRTSPNLFGEDPHNDIEINYQYTDNPLKP